ncbi:hypothetical protein ACHQM5_024150 [Ranunculus cassubicifolius]
MNSIKHLLVIPPPFTTVIITAKPPAHWIAPPLITLKLNVDISFISDILPLGIGYVLRDNLANFVAGGTGVDRVSTAEAGECCGIRSAAIWAYSVGCTSLIIESDHKDAINFLKRVANNISWLNSGMLEEVLLLSSLFESFEVVHVTRDNNMVAHILANQARYLGAAHWDSCSPPDFIRSALVKDAEICNKLCDIG